jgi:hypothetical protein
MFSYYKKLLDSNSPESSKRYMATMSFHLLVLVIIFSIITKRIIDPNIYYILGGLAMGSQITTLFNSRQNGNS